ncbi:MAG: phage virion morphogenesis protein [Acidobacteriota bacterium]
MTGAAVQIRIEGGDRLRARLERLLARAGGPSQRDLLGRLGALVESQTRRRIQDGGPDPDGRPWEPLSPGYAAWKAGRSSGKILSLHGPLRDSLTHEVVSTEEARVGSGLVYAAIHQFGGLAGRGHVRSARSGAESGGAWIPARAYLGVSANDLDDLQDELDAWADDLVEGRP